MRLPPINVRRPVSMEKTGLADGGRLRLVPLNTVARSSGPLVLVLGNDGWMPRKTGRNGRWNGPSAAFPAHPVAGVFEDHADGAERVPDPVRRGEVFPLPRVLSERHDQVQQSVDGVRALRRRREDAEDLAEGPERPRGLVEGRPPGTSCCRSSTTAVTPVYASACAISASWWGNRSSVAPPCRSYWGPK